MSARPHTVTALRSWLADGEILGPDGAMHAWYDAESGERSFPYPEITGYALTHYASRAEPTGAELTAAEAATAWLLRRIEAGNLAARDGWESGGVYYFDLAMIANGLLAIADRRSLPAAREGADRLVALMVAEIDRCGQLPALPTGQVTRRTGWSVTGRAHMGKAVQCLLHAAHATPGESRADLDRATAAVVAQTLAEQQPDGRFRTDADDEVTMLHPHLYAVEGLWCHARATGDSRTADAARAGAQWVWRHQLPTGGLPRFVATGRGQGAGDPPEQLDLTAQAVRAAALTGVEPDAAARAADRLVGVVVDRGGSRAALPYQPESTTRHLNAWVTLFAVQALELASGTSVPDWQLLV